MSDKKKNVKEEQQLNKEENRNEGEDQTSHEESHENNYADISPEEFQKKIEQLENEREDLKDKYLRKAAEFENYKRRTEQEFAALTKYANEQLITDLLPVIDDFERSLHVSKDRREYGPFHKGVELIYQKLTGLLHAKGVKPIESEGKEFDVELHDALMQVPKEDVDPNTIIEEVEKGYFYKDKVIRHAKVVVAKEPDGEESNSDDQTRENVNQRESN